MGIVMCMMHYRRNWNLAQSKIIVRKAETLKHKLKAIISRGVGTIFFFLDREEIYKLYFDPKLPSICINQKCLMGGGYTRFLVIEYKWGSGNGASSAWRFLVLRLSLGTHLFVKVYLDHSGDSKETFSVFESSCHLLLPV